MRHLTQTGSFLFPYCYLSFNKATEFRCNTNTGSRLPELPESFSTNIRVNYDKNQYTTEIKYSRNGNDQKESIEFKTAERQVNYIVRGDQTSVLIIVYNEEQYPECIVKKTVNITEFMDNKDAGPNGIFAKTILSLKKVEKFYPAAAEKNSGIFLQSWEGCLDDPKINISMSYAVSDWEHSHTSTKSVHYPVRADAEIDGVYMTAFYSNFNPVAPDNAVFQPPEDVYCDGFRTTKMPPYIRDYFSYNAEIITYGSSYGIAPIVSQRKVYYDYPARISRIDFDDPLAPDEDVFSPISIQDKSIIHDFNAGVQYSFSPFAGSCTQDSFKAAYTVLYPIETENKQMLNGKEFFWLDKATISYNGQFPIRGLMADVYTAVKIDPQTKKNCVISWYFSTEETRVVENENVEKNVLLRMRVRPETGSGKKGTVIVNLYNFDNEEPSTFNYDLRRCYNETSSKHLVLTFPGDPSLKGYEKVIGTSIQLLLKAVTGMRKQRIFVSEVALNEKYLFAEFYLLEAPSGSSVQSKEISLDDAIKKLEKSISAGNFSVNIFVGKEVILLKPEPNGLNVFAGDRSRKPNVIGYEEGGVISLTVGMLLLGFLLGAVTLNLVISRKFGVSLFQKSQYGSSPFNDSHNESSM